MKKKLTSEDLLKGMKKYEKPEIKRERVMTFMFDGLKKDLQKLLVDNVPLVMDADKFFSLNEHCSKIMNKETL